MATEEHCWTDAAVIIHFSYSSSFIFHVVAIHPARVFVAIAVKARPFPRPSLSSRPPGSECTAVLLGSLRPLISCRSPPGRFPYPDLP